MAFSDATGSSKASDATQIEENEPIFIRQRSSPLATEKQKLLSELGNVEVPFNAAYCYMQQYEDILEGEGCYPMDHSPRGQAVVVTMTERRPGWQSDVKALQKMFLYLDVRPHHVFDVTHQQLVEELESFAEREVNKKADVLFVVLMGHGGKVGEEGPDKNKEYLQTSDGRFYVRENLASIFNNQKHPYLIDKPKVFLVQMCRGAASSIDESDASADRGQTRGIPPQEELSTLANPSIPELRGTPSGDIGYPIQESRLPDPVLVIPESRPRDIHEHMPDFTDYLIGFATQPGLLSYREPDEGTWYIQELTKVVIEKAAHRQVTNMLEEVNALLVKGAPNRKGRQVGESVLGLTKPLYLFPGLQRLDKPLKLLNPPPSPLEIQVDNPFRVLGLPDKGALLTYGYSTFHLKRVSVDGHQRGSEFITDNDINALVLQNNELHVLVLESTGEISRCSMDKLDGPPTKVGRVKVSSLWDAAAISHKDVILIDKSGGQVIAYDLESKCTDTKVTGLDSPSSITCDNTGASTIFAIAEEGQNRVLLYDSSWTKIGEVGNKQGKKLIPSCAVFLPPLGSQKLGHLLIADRDNHRLSEFNRNGAFLRHWLTSRNGLKHPIAVSFVFPYVWVVHSPRQKTVSRYQIFDE